MLAKEQFVVDFVKEVRQINSKIGGVKLWEMYSQEFGEEYSLGRDAFTRILYANNLNVRLKKRKVQTTNSEHDFLKYPDLIKQLLLERKNQVWVSDITYIPLESNELRFCFLSLITDAFTKEIIGYHVGETLETTHTLKALNMAIKSQPPQSLSTLIHHSDRGVQYACHLYTDRLRDAGIRISMTESGDPKDNAIAERVNGIIKQEFLEHQELKTIEDVRNVLKKAIPFYNEKRPHRSLAMMTPAQAAQNPQKIKKLWKSYKEQYCSKVA